MGAAVFPGLRLGRGWRHTATRDPPLHGEEGSGGRQDGWVEQATGYGTL